jgi:hypothetical protein
MRFKIVVVILMILFSDRLSAQNDRCGTTLYTKQLLDKDPELKKTYLSQQVAADQRLQNISLRTSALITIPVVFHIVYNTAEQNVTDERILEQLNVLNKDYARLNQDAQSTPTAFGSVAASANIQFCLAKRDPNNKPTTGIERKFTTNATFSNFDDVKKVSAGGIKGWSKNKYLNIWVCNLSGSLLGYASTPGTANDTLDGVVVSYATIGGPDAPGIHPTYNLGRTLTHEVGHWLNLIHVWGDDGGTCTGSDNVNDTPNQASEHYGTPNFPIISCNNGPNGDMFMNYLDYSDDYVMNIFTEGQSVRMNDALINARAAILNSNGCSDTTTPIDLALIAILHANGFYCSGNINPSVQIKNKGTSSITNISFSIKVDDDAPVIKVWNGSLIPGQSIAVALDPLTVSSGTHYLTISATVLNDGNLSNNILVNRLTVGAPTALPYAQDFEQKRFPADNWSVINSDHNATFMRSRLSSTKGNSSLWYYAAPGTADGLNDDIILEPLDLTTLNEPVLAFDLACLHDNSIASNNSLKIFVSTDCGLTYEEIFSKSGTNLATANGSAASVFTPASNQWRKDSVNLKNYGSFNNVIIKFEYTSGNANVLFIDNLQIDRLGVIYPDASNINVSVLGQTEPGFLNFSVLLLKSEDFKVDIIDATGRKVFSENFYGNAYSGKLNLLHLNAGIYFFRVSSGNDVETKKIFFR